MSWTKRQIVEQALEELGLASYVFDMQPEQVESAKLKLDTMMGLWDAKDIRFGYPLGSSAKSGDLDEETHIPDYAIEAVRLNLAIRLASSFGKAVPVELKAMAKDAFETIQLAMLSNPPRVRLDPSLPRGAGHKGDCLPFVEKTPTKTVFAPDTSVSFTNE